MFIIFLAHLFSASLVSLGEELFEEVDFLLKFVEQRLFVRCERLVHLATFARPLRRRDGARVARTPTQVRRLLVNVRHAR